MLRSEAVLERLLEALSGIERLVLLGDVAELMAHTVRRGLAAAEPVIRAIGRRLERGAEVVIVPGNHDLNPIYEWVLRRRELGLDDIVPPGATGGLGRLTDWLAPARVEVRYPGMWLGDRIWATHGHYLDRHLMPASTYGLPRPGRQTGAVAPFAYERRLRDERGGSAGLLLRLLGGARAVVVPALPHLLLNARMSGVNASLIDLQMRRAALPAMARVAARLQVQADWVLFGHTHRPGPLHGDDAGLWRPVAGGPRLVNCGSWLWEPLLVAQARPPHPYWPGSVVLLEPGGEPRLLSLLEDLSPGELSAAG